MPRFVWVCELYKVDAYLNPKNDAIEAFGEIVLDTTSAPTKKNAGRAIILFHYPGIFAKRDPEDIQEGFNKMVVIDNDGPFPGFSNTLTKII